MKRTMRARVGIISSLLASLVAISSAVADPLPQVQRAKFVSGSKYLVLEFLDEDLVHFEVSGVGTAPSENLALFTTPQVAKTDYVGPVNFARNGSTLETSEIRVTVATDSLCMTVTDKVRNQSLTTICPLELNQPNQRLQLGAGVNAYGLGEQFISPGVADGDWTGGVRSPGDAFGNQMTSFNGGSTGNCQIPILYSLGTSASSSANYALMLDHIYKQTWDFTVNPWRVNTGGDQIRGYLMTGPNLPDLRRDYMELVGRPPVPPKQIFGMWVSEYGYDSWQEVDSKLSTLIQNNFPVDGFMLDLQWFGGITANSENSNMGRLSWDLIHFPDPASTLAEYKSEEGVSFIPIEESYVSRGLPEYDDLKTRGYLVRACAGCDPAHLTGNPWWGIGGMLDWTYDEGADYWHDLKRQALVDDGVIGHWTDLGEPEMYKPNDWTVGVLPGKHGHADYHNVYSLKWAESIARGYERNLNERRPFILTRSGAAGIQRFGAAMWSGDIGGNLSSLATHFNAQMHMSFSGIDYFGSDIAGFHRGAVSGDPNDVYTRWFANSMWLDVPGRPHTENLCNCKETAPDRIGNLASNLANIRQRYELVPYLYSLAYRAYRDGEPYAPPLVYYYQDDPNVRELGSHKLIGRDILVAGVTETSTSTRDVYLPAGDWINYHTGEWLHSSGQTFAGQPLFIDGVFRIPAYVRAGAILPKMSVDAQTANTLGKRRDNSVRNELVVRAYAAANETTFELYEDDGETVAYRTGDFQTTVLRQESVDDTTTVTIEPVGGGYPGAVANRNNVVELVLENQQATSVTFNGVLLPEQLTQADFDDATAGWLNLCGGLVLAKSGVASVSTAKSFVFTTTTLPVLGCEDLKTSAKFICDMGVTAPGESVYVLGNQTALGNWQARDAIKLEPDGPYPRWTKVIEDLPSNTNLEWKCIKRLESGNIDNVLLYEPGANNVLTTPSSGFAGTTLGNLASAGVLSDVTAQFVCDSGTTVPGESVYVVGNQPQLGSWQAQSAVKLEPTNTYPRWTGTIGGLPSNTSIEWKCIKRQESGNTSTVNLWEPGSNNVLSTPSFGDAGATFGNFGS